MLYYSIDMLWTFAFASALSLVLSRRLLCAAIVMLVTCLYELGQHYGIVRGIGDIWDVFFSFIAVLIFLLFFKEDHHEKAS